MAQPFSSLGGRRIGGILIAFTSPTVKDKFGNYWTKDTDLALQRYSRRPVYFQHRGQVMEAGYIDPASFEIRDEGLYAEADLLDNEAGRACLDYTIRGKGFWSTGVMPYTWCEAADGWVEMWPFVEASITDHPMTRFGLTQAGVVRSTLGLAAAENGDEFLRRGPVFMFNGKHFFWSDGEQLPGAGPAVVAPPAPVAVPAPAAPVITDDQLARVMRGILNEQPGRSLQPAPLPAGLHPPTPVPQDGAPNLALNPRLAVSHRFDDMSLAGLALWGQLRLKAGRMRGEHETEFMRALIDKVERQRKRDEQIPDEQIMRGAVRMVDSQVRMDWGHIRANEAMTSTYVGYGDELVPTLLSSVLWYHFITQSNILGSLRRMQLPSQPFDWPIVTGGPTIRRIPQLVDQANFSVHASKIPTSKITTNKITFNVGEIGALVLAEQTLFEDSGYSIADMWSTQMMRQMARALGSVILNGDEAADVNNISHLGVDPTGTDYDAFLILNGLRKMSFTDVTTVAQATIDANSTVGLRAKLGARGKFGLNPKACLNVVDPGIYYKLLQLASIESIADVGDMGTLVTGAVGQIKGVPVVVADEIENTDAAGKVPSAHNGTKGSHAVLNRENIVVGIMRDVTTELAKIPGTGGYFMDITVRLDVQEMEAGQVAVGYNSTI